MRLRTIVAYVPGSGYQDPYSILFVEPTTRLMDIACNQDRAVVFDRIEFEINPTNGDEEAVEYFEYPNMPVAMRLFETTKKEVIECWIEYNLDRGAWLVRYRGDECDETFRQPSLKQAFDRWSYLSGAEYDPMIFAKRYEWDEYDDDDGSQWCPDIPASKPVVAKTPRPETFGTWS